jgi:hypothetical protein
MAHTEGKTARAYLGRIVKVEGQDYKVDADMVQCVQDYLNACPVKAEVFVEQRLPITAITGEADAFGTADRVAFLDDEIVIDDLKTGKGVRVEAEGNKQLAIYAQAAVNEFSPVFTFKRARLRIIQTRMDHVSEWCMTVEELAAFVGQIKPATEVTPGDDQCRWCRNKATCTALNATVIAEFEDLQPAADADEIRLARALSKVDLIETWCKAVRAEALKRLEDGTVVPGFKLVAGKKGARGWRDVAEAEQVLKAMRIKHDEMYNYAVISPTQAEKLAKAEVIGPRQWPKLQELITQSEGGLHVAPESDKRPAVTVAQFEELPAEEFV